MAILSALLILLNLPAGGSDHDIIVEIENIKYPEGEFMVAVFDCPEKFMSDQTCSSLIAPVTSGGSQKLRVPVKNPGTYAICMFQDVNKNGKLDRNRFGVPNEPYGFSNNPTTIWGPPGFDKASFRFNGYDGEQQTIRLK